MVEQQDLFDGLEETGGMKIRPGDTHCPCCGASLKMYWHRMTPSLAKTLVKIYTAISAKGENRIHPHDEMDLSTSEHMNMTKLRFHGLIAKCREDGKIERGYWLITKRGAQFLKGDLFIPKRVQTFRNKVVDHDPDVVDIARVMGSAPYIESEFDYELFGLDRASILV